VLEPTCPEVPVNRGWGETHLRYRIVGDETRDSRDLPAIPRAEVSDNF